MGISKVRKFEDLTERCETGAIQFGEDSPGYFIRGEDVEKTALYWEEIKRSIFKNEKVDVAQFKSFDNMIKILSEFRSN